MMWDTLYETFFDLYFVLWKILKGETNNVIVYRVMIFVNPSLIVLHFQRSICILQYYGGDFWKYLNREFVSMYY